MIFANLSCVLFPLLCANVLVCGNCGMASVQCCLVIELWSWSTKLLYDGPI